MLSKSPNCHQTQGKTGYKTGNNILNIIGKLGIALTLLSGLSSVHAKAFNSGSVEVFGYASAIMGASDDNSSPAEPNSSYFGISLKGLYYVIPSLGVGVDFYHYDAAYNYSNGNSASRTTNIWSPTIAYNSSIGENSAFLFGASKTGMLYGKSTTDYEVGPSTQIKYSGNTKFIYFRHYISSYVALATGLVFEKYIKDYDNGNRHENHSTNVEFGIVIGFTK